MNKEKVIFLGNGPLAEYALAVLERECQIIFHARTKEDLEEVVRLKRENPEAHAVLASYGVMVPERVLAEFEPEGILNIHPSLLPKYRGASPIESAILAGDTDFSVSVMKLAKAMDAGPVYAQATIEGLPLDKDRIYFELARCGANMAIMVMQTSDEAFKGKDYKDEFEKMGKASGRPDIVESHEKWIENVRHPKLQDETKATYCGKLEKKMGILQPETETAEEIYRKIVAFQGFPKAKYVFFGKNCAILEAHILEVGETADLVILCADGRAVAVDRLQPDGKKPMDAKSFINGYKK